MSEDPFAIRTVDAPARGFAKSEFVKIEIQEIGEMPGRVGWLQTGSQNNHLEPFLLHFTRGCRIIEDEVLRYRIFVDGREAATVVTNAMCFSRFGEVGAVLFVEGALINREYAAFNFGPQTLFGQHCFFGGIHATNGRTEVVGLITRANAL